MKSRGWHRECIPTSHRAAQISRQADTIREWLLSDRPQIRGGNHDGGVLGWVSSERRGCFVYPEIIGYYLTALAFIAAENDQFDIRCTERASRALAWLECREKWLTRDYLEEHGVEDWRNFAVFVFDLGMLLAGISHWTRDSRTGSIAARLQSRVVAELESIPRTGGDLASHRMRLNADTYSLPYRWSTVPGPHLVKVAGIIASIPDLRSRHETLEVAAATLRRWTKFVEADSGPIEVHPTLYFLEGLVLAEGSAALSFREDAKIRHVLRRILLGQHVEGDLPQQINPPAGPRRADVTAQALRLCATVMRFSERSDDFAPHADGLYAALTRQYLESDGGVLSFPRGCMSSDSFNPANVWATIFAYQALRLYAAAVRNSDVPAALLQRLA